MTFELREQAACEQGRLAEPAYARWRTADGDVAATLHRAGGGYLVRFVDRADFSIALDEGVITCRPAPRTPARVTRDLYLNQLLPMIRGHLGELIIHASAAAVDGGAVAFVAQTGRGKSTLAAAFARAGMPFLSDDGLCLAAEGGRYLASPNRSSFRLWLDSEAEVVLGKAAPDEWDQDAKSRVEASDSLPFQAEPLPLRAMYFLGPGEAAKPVIVGLPMREALAQLLNHSFFLDAEDRVRMTRHFEALTRLAEAVPSFALDYPRDYALLPDVIAAVTGHDIEREPAL